MSIYHALHKNDFSKEINILWSSEDLNLLQEVLNFTSKNIYIVNNISLVSDADLKSQYRFIGYKIRKNYFSGLCILVGLKNKNVLRNI